MFLIVMGISLGVVAWRIALTTSAWNARLIVAGGLLLGFGYAVLLPMREVGFIAALAHPRAAVAETFGWHTVLLVVMNGGWLLFGTGMARHARILPSAAPVAKALTHPIP